MSDLVVEGGSKGADGRRKLNVGESMYDSGFRFEIRKDRWINFTLPKRCSEHRGRSDCCPDVLDSSDAELDGVIVNIDYTYTHDFEMSTAAEFNCRPSVPSQYVSLQSVWGRQPSWKSESVRGKTQLEIKFCYASEAIKLERTETQKDKDRVDGGKGQTCRGTGFRIASNPCSARRDTKTRSYLRFCNT